MTSLEKEVRTKHKKENIQKAILSTIKAVSVLSVAMLAPNALKLFPSLGYRRGRERINTSIERMLESGLIKFEQTDKGKFIRLTEKGESKLYQILAREGPLPKPKKWDKRWRIVIYDVKEYKKQIRNKLKSTLEGFGFRKLQNSVWIYPYDCEDLITLLKADFQIGKEVLYLIVEKLENDRWLKKDFHLETFNKD